MEVCIGQQSQKTQQLWMTLIPDFIIAKNLKYLKFRIHVECEMLRHSAAGRKPNKSVAKRCQRIETTKKYSEKEW